MKLNNKMLNVILNLDYVIAGTSLVILILVTFLGVIMRYFLNNPFIWQEEVQLWCFVWTVFFGAGAAFRTKSHIAIDILVDSFPNKAKKVVEFMNYLITVAVLVYLYRHGNTLVNQLATTARVTNILKVPYAVIYRAFPISCIIMIINQSLIYSSEFINIAEKNIEEIEEIGKIGDEEWI